jgi:glycosyltransferase involved in cell wall biosynthesis
MIIVHIAPFAPNACGLYEAARDMSRADILGGNNVYFVDAGVSRNGVRENGIVGQVDQRGDFRLETNDPSFINEADIIIMHTGCNDGWIVKTQAPIIWAVHGRPLACFRPERINKNDFNSFTLYHEISKWKRVKGMLYFWPEFKPYWESVLSSKDIVLDYPVIDERRFFIKDINVLENKGEINLLLCDSEREDVCNYEVVNGLIQACKRFKNIKVHICGIDLLEGNKIPNCWDVVLGKLKELGGLGNIYGRLTNMLDVYNSVDCVISPNKIITRTIGEALTCGIPVISEVNETNLVSDYTCNMSNPKDVIQALEWFIDDFKNNKIDQEAIRKRAEVFSLKNYSIKMNEIYKKVLS